MTQGPEDSPVAPGLGPEAEPESIPESEQPARPRRWKTGPLIPLLGIGLCAYFLAQAKDEIAYVFSSAVPVDLGTPDAYDFSRAADGVYATVSGDVHGEPARYQRGFDKGKVWPLYGAPLMIERRGESTMGKTVTARGELRMDSTLPPQYRPVITAFMKRDLLAAPGPRFHTDHVWVLIDGHRPRSLDAKSGWLLLLVLVLLVNVYLLFRRPVR
jgi:hypothetical protein